MEIGALAARFFDFSSFTASRISVAETVTLSFFNTTARVSTSTETVENPGGAGSSLGFMVVEMREALNLIRLL